MDHGHNDFESRSGSVSGRFSFDSLAENLVVPLQEHSFTTSSTAASHDAIVHDQNQNGDYKKELPWFLMYMSSYIHLSALGILGALTRYELEILFGPEMIGLTGDHSILYLDLPPNMVGSFLMGWFGAVYKGDISTFSPELAVGLTTGYLGSLTTFSGWNQKMLELSVDGQWVSSVLGFVLGLFLVLCSFISGVGTAKCFKWAFNKTNLSAECCFCEVNNIMIQSMLLVVMVIILGLEWGVSVAVLKKDFNGDSNTIYLWVGCLVGPIGVWARFYLAQLNGKGLGRREMMKWMPFGTLIANVAAACIMAVFATMKKAVNEKDFDIVAKGIQFGLSGCLSTVSTFNVEFEAMRGSIQSWRAYVYALSTIIISFTLGTLIYSLPVWTKGWS